VDATNPTAEEIAARLTAAIVAEGKAILSDGIALCAAAIDLVKGHGTVYPHGRRGPVLEAAQQSGTSG
jgi:3-hydroxyacyl-CoA dehydrogenase